jgi:copper(I)-binding protein
MNKPSLYATLLTILWTGSAVADPALTVRGAWIAEAPPTAKVQAGYMELVNGGGSPVVVVGGKSPDFAQVEMHRTVQAQDGARMEPQAELRVEPGATLLLAPGGLHLMLIEPKRRLGAGAAAECELRRQDRAPTRRGAAGRRPAPPAAEH